jgi:hypothetical protein
VAGERVAGEDESPFARIPTPGVTYETPSPITPMGEIAAYGTMARGVRSRSRIAGRLFGLVFLLLIVGGTLFGVVGWFFLDDSEPAPSPPPIPTSITSTPSWPPAPVPPPS